MDFYGTRWMERETYEMEQAMQCMHFGRHANPAACGWKYPNVIGNYTPDGEGLTQDGIGLAPSPLKMQITVQREGCEPLVVLNQSPIGLPTRIKPVTAVKYTSPVFQPCAQTDAFQFANQEICLSLQDDFDDEPGVYNLALKMSERYYNMPGMNDSVFLEGSERVSVVGPETVVVDHTLESGLRLQLWIQH